MNGNTTMSRKGSRGSTNFSVVISACLFPVVIDEERLFLIENHFFADNHFLDIFATWNFKHNIEPGYFSYSSEATDPGFADDRFLSHGANGAVGELQFDIFKLK